MAGETVITVVGNLTADPELRFTPSGAAVANFTVASTPRTFDRQSGEWKDGEALFLRCNVWRQAAENVAESLTRGIAGHRVRAAQQRSFETKEGEKRTVIELEVDEIGPSLRYATAKVNKVAPQRWRRWRRRRWRRRRRRLRWSAAAPAGGYDDPWGPRRRPARRRRGRRAAVLEPLTFPDTQTPLRSTPMPKPTLRKPKKKVCAFCKDKAHLHRLQGHRPAAEVHLRPRQDPRPPGQRQLHASTSGTSPWR